MNTPELMTNRLILRRFTPGDVPALLAIHADEQVNTFLPWFPLKTMEEADAFYKERYEALYRRKEGYGYAICLKEDNMPIGYVGVDGGESHDLGYGLRRDFWHRGIVTEAARAVVERVRADGMPYLTATHDVNNPRSGAVMKRLGMRYAYSYVEQWQPKNIRVTFRLYQLNMDGEQDRVYRAYWETYPEHFIEEGV